MPFVIHPYRKLLFWVKAITFGMFYLPILYGVFFSNMATIITLVICVTPLALLLTWLFVRDRVFTFQDHVLTIKSSLDFYPFNRMFKKYTIDFDQIDRISLAYSSGRYWGVSLTVIEKSDPATAVDVHDIAAKTKDLKSKHHSFFLDNVQRHTMFKWEAAFQSMGLKVIVKE